MKATVDKATCIGCGLCVDVCPQVFKTKKLQRKTWWCLLIQGPHAVMLHNSVLKTLQEGVNLVKANYREFRSLAGLDMTDDKQLEEQAVKMVKDGRCEVMVISLGAAGALVVSEKVVEHFSSPTVSNVSKIGAGDSMVAGMILKLARGQALRDAVRLFN
jgi:fructose-1-phosphate kinase PfkB-like protein